MLEHVNLQINEEKQEMQDTQIGKRVTLSTGKGNEAGITHSLQTSMSGASFYAPDLLY